MRFRFRPFILTLAAFAAFVAADVRAGNTLKRAKNIYPLPVEVGENSSTYLKSVRRHVRGRKIVTDDVVIELSQPIRSIKINPAMASLVIDAADEDFELLVEHVLEPLASVAAPAQTATK